MTSYPSETKSRHSFTRRHALFGLTAITSTILLPTFAMAKKPDIYSSGGFAIHGYDPVAYFVASEPQEGKSEFEFTHLGATFRFANADNLAAFKANPDNYTPQYGGYCAWAVSLGYTASIHPFAWSVVDDKLYLNYSKRVQRQWTAGQDNRITLADQNWPAVLDR